MKAKNVSTVIPVKVVSLLFVYCWSFFLAPNIHWREHIKMYHDDVLYQNKDAPQILVKIVHFDAIKIWAFYLVLF